MSGATDPPQGSPPRVGGPAAPLRVAVLVAVLFAFSPVLLDLVRHLQAHEWALGSLVLLVLYGWMALRHADRWPRPEGAGWGFLAIAVGLAIEMAAIAGGVVRLGRPGLVIAAIGASRTLGRLPNRISALLLWAIPLPHALMSLGSPGLETLWARCGTVVAQGLGLTIAREFSALETATARLELQPVDGGLSLVWLLVGLAAFISIRNGEAFSRAIPRAGLFGLLGFALQALAVCVAIVLLGRGTSLETLQAGLSWFPTVTVALLAVLILPKSGWRSADESGGERVHA